MDMPKLSPLAINIKQKKPLSRIWHWQGFVREWELLEDWHYQLPNNEPIIILPKGFTFDGVSVPRPFHWFLSPTGVLFIPGLVHDFAYRYDYLWAIDEKGEVYHYKKDAGRYHWDSMFRHLGLSLNGMHGLNSFARMVLFVLGGFSWKKNRENQAKDIEPNGHNYR